MKKLLVLVGAVALVGSTFAQKPSADDSKFSLEGGLNYAGGSGINWSAPSIRLRYFVNDNIAGRLQLGIGDGIGGTPRTEEFQYAEGGTGTGIGTEKFTRMQWMVQIGGEYHLAGTDRLSPYFMLGINLGGGSETEEWTDFDGSGYMLGRSRKIMTGASMFGFSLGAGMDFYIFENVYLGLELGLSYMTRTIKGIEDASTVGGVTTTTTGLDSKESYLGTLPMNAAFRLGWRF